MRRYSGFTVYLWLAVGVTVLAGICLWHFRGAVVSHGDELSGRKYHAKEFFADPKVAELAEAAREGNVEQVDALLSQGTSVNSAGKEGITVLMYSMSGGNLKGFRRLLERGANPNQQTDQGESAVSFASCRKEPEALKLLLAHGGNPNLRDPKSSFEPTPIFGAARANRVDNARILIRAGADLNARTSFGNTPLVSAARLNSFDVMHVLLEAGADFRAKNAAGYTVTHELFDDSGAVVLTDELMKSKQRCMDFLEKEGVNFEQERLKNAEIARQIEKRLDAQKGTPIPLP